jgi:hypothetical protein
LKLLERHQKSLIFGLSKREKGQLIRLLGLYPRVPAVHQRLSKTGCLPQMEEAQKLLEEALAEQRNEHRKNLGIFLAAPSRFEESDKGVIFTMSESEAEWLLQVLNDIRIGSWILAGSPDNIFKVLNAHTAPNISAMEIAGFFEAHLLDAIAGE